jgi:hypothetical protein
LVGAADGLAATEEAPISRVALPGKEIPIDPNSPSEGVRVAFIVADGAPVELLEVRYELPLADEPLESRIVPQ